MTERTHYLTLFKSSVTSYLALIYPYYCAGRAAYPHTSCSPLSCLQQKVQCDFSAFCLVYCKKCPHIYGSKKVGRSFFEFTKAVYFLPENSKGFAAFLRALL